MGTDPVNDIDYRLDSGPAVKPRNRLSALTFSLSRFYQMLKRILRR